MIFIYEELKHEVDQESIKLSEELVAQLRLLEAQPSFAQLEGQLNKQILAADQAYRDAITVGDQQKAKEEGAAFQKALMDRRYPHDQVYRQREKLSRKVEEFSKPVIERTCQLIDSAIPKIHAEMIVTWKDTRKVFKEEPTRRTSSKFMDPQLGEESYRLIEVETNRAAIWETTAFLSKLKANLHRMYLSSLSKILQMVEEGVSKANAVDLRKVETEKIGELAYKELTEPEKVPTVSQEIYKLAQLGKQAQLYEETKAFIKGLKDSAASNVTGGRITKYEQLGGKTKEALDLVYGKD